VTSASDGKVLKQTRQVKAGDLLTTRLNDGWVESEVKTITAVKKPGRRKSNVGYTAAAHSTRFSKSARARSGKNNPLRHTLLKPPAVCGNPDSGLAGQTLSHSADSVHSDPLCQRRATDGACKFHDDSLPNVRPPSLPRRWFSVAHAIAAVAQARAPLR
jgi:hypothetical protein